MNSSQATLTGLAAAIYIDCKEYDDNRESTARFFHRCIQ